MKWTVPVKGVLIDEGNVLLGLNDREEWELPGGQLDEGESPEEAVVREFREESGVSVSPRWLLMAEIFEVVPGRNVLIVAFNVVLNGMGSGIVASPEHEAMEWIPLKSLPDLPLPGVYRRAVASSLALTE